MPKYSTAFGMDVHLRSTTVCALDADTGEAVTRRFDLCQDFGHGIERNHAAIGIASGLGSGRSKKASLGSVRSKKSAMASAGTL